VRLFRCQDCGQALYFENVRCERCRALDEKRPDAALLASAAKARTSDAANLIGREAIQMFGGIGMTDEDDIGFFIKRSAVAEQTFGDANYHRNRYGELEGY
jgi:acyl-CoA dehydrogenase